MSRTKPLQVFVGPYVGGSTVATLHALCLTEPIHALACAAGVCIRRYLVPVRPRSDEKAHGYERARR